MGEAAALAALRTLAQFGTSFAPQPDDAGNILGQAAIQNANSRIAQIAVEDQEKEKKKAEKSGLFGSIGGLGGGILGAALAPATGGLSVAGPILGSALGSGAGSALGGGSFSGPALGAAAQGSIGALAPSIQGQVAGSLNSGAKRGSGQAANIPIATPAKTGQSTTPVARTGAQGNIVPITVGQPAPKQSSLLSQPSAPVQATREIEVTPRPQQGTSGAPVVPSPSPGTPARSSAPAPSTRASAPVPIVAPSAPSTPRPVTALEPSRQPAPVAVNQPAPRQGPDLSTPKGRAINFVRNSPQAHQLLQNVASAATRLATPRIPPIDVGLLPPDQAAELRRFDLAQRGQEERSRLADAELALRGQALAQRGQSSGTELRAVDIPIRDESGAVIGTQPGTVRIDSTTGAPVQQPIAIGEGEINQPDDPPNLAFSTQTVYGTGPNGRFGQMTMRVGQDPQTGETVSEEPVRGSFKEIDENNFSVEDMMINGMLIPEVIAVDEKMKNGTVTKEDFQELQGVLKIAKTQKAVEEAQIAALAERGVDPTGEVISQIRFKGDVKRAAAQFLQRSGLLGAQTIEQAIFGIGGEGSPEISAIIETAGNLMSGFIRDPQFAGVDLQNLGDFSFDPVDLTDDDGNPTGTGILLTINGIVDENGESPSWRLGVIPPEEGVE